MPNQKQHKKKSAKAPSGLEKKVDDLSKMMKKLQGVSNKPEPLAPLPKSNLHMFSSKNDTHGEFKFLKTDRRQKLLENRLFKR